MSARTHTENSGHTGHHILPLKVYYIIAAVLIIFTVITVAVSRVDFGAMNMVIAMGVAAFKASLVCLFFMHLLYDNKLYALVFVTSLIFLAIFITLVMYDVVRRDGVYIDKQDPIVEQAVIYEDTSSGESGAEVTTSDSADHSAVTDSSAESTTESTTE